MIVDIKIAYRNLFRNYRRTITILLTILLGTGALYLYHGFNNGIMNQYRINTIKSRFGNGQLNTIGYRDKVFEKPWEQWITNYEDISKFAKSIPEVTHVFPRIQFFGLLTNGEISISGRGQGVDAAVEAEFFTALSVEKGKQLTTEEDGIVLGIGLARALGVGLGDRVTILANTTYGSMNGADTYVTGIFHTGAKEFDDTVFRIPLKLAMVLLDSTKVESIALGLKGVESWDEVAKQLTEKFPKLEATPFEILDKVYYQNSVDFLKSQFDFIRFIIIFIVILGIFNTVSTSILERKQEIGNLRANGESKIDVLRLLVVEGVLLGLLGSFLGVLAATLLNYTLLAKGIPMPPGPGITKSFMVKVELVPLYAITILVLGALTAFIGTIAASLKVLKEDIGNLLRSV